MMVPGMSNVVVLDRGTQGAMAKGSSGKSNTDDPDRGTTEAEVTVLYPRAKAGANAWVKAQKAATEADAQKQDDGHDASDGQNVFGSLVASVEQRLIQQENPLASDSTSGSADSVVATPEPATRSIPQIMGRGKLAEVLQNFKEKPIAGEIDNHQFAVSIAKQSAAPANTVGSNPDETVLPSVEFSRLQDVEAKSFPAQNNLAVPTTDRTRSKEVLSVKSTIGSLQLSKPSTDKAEDRAPVAAPTMALASGSDDAEKLENSTAAVKPIAAEKKEPNLPKAEPAEISHPHVEPASYPLSGEGKFLSPVAQIVENIRNAVAAAPVIAPEVTANPVPVKTLEVQLQPEGLGLVTVSLKSEQGKLKVEISARLETTRHELERHSIELVSGLQRVDPTIKAADINFSNQNQGTAPDNGGQATGSGGERRSTPENLSGFGSNGGRDANQSSANARHEGHEHHRHGHKRPAGELPSRRALADGIYL